MRLAVIFPGIGYHVDKPLLYYAKKLAKKFGYIIKEVPYTGLQKSGMLGDREKMQEAFENALKQAEDMLADVAWQDYEEILFISKSVGTVVAAAYSQKLECPVNHILFTPVEATFPYLDRAKEKAVAFHGTKDPWVTTDIVKEGCALHEIPLYITEKTNHSLETGEVSVDLENLMAIMSQAEDFIWKTTPGVYRVLNIREDDYGCEEVEEDQPVLSQVILEDADGMQQMLRYPDAELIEKDINKGDFISFEGRKITVAGVRNN